jgi:hypothetical protein
VLTDLKRFKRRSDYQVEAARLSSSASGDSAGVSLSNEEAAQQTAGPTAGFNGRASRTMSSAEYVVTEIKRHKRVVIFAVVGLAIVSAGLFFGLRYLRPATVSRGPMPFGQTKVTKLTSTGTASQAAISPDGKYVIHVSGGAGKQSLLLRHIARAATRRSWLLMEATSHGSHSHAMGSYVLYSRVEDGIYPLFQVPVLGGTPAEANS